MVREKEPRRISPLRGVTRVGPSSESREGEPSPVSAFFFPGQGKPLEIVKVAEGLYRTYTLVIKMYEDASEVLGYSLADMSFNQQEKLEKTQYAQPAIFVATLAAHRVYEQESRTKKGKESGFTQPTFFAGHSVGEFAAAVASGSLSFLNGVNIIGVRGKAMQEACDAQETGMDAIIGITEEQLREFLTQFPTIDLCLINSQQQIVVGGPVGDLKEGRNWLKNSKIRTMNLKGANGAFHSRYMLPAKEEIAGIIEKTIFVKANVPLVVEKNGKAETIQNPKSIKTELAYQTNNTFNWRTRTDYVSSQQTTETVELAHTDLSEIIKKSSGGDYKSIITHLGVFIGSRWQPNLQTA